MKLSNSHPQINPELFVLNYENFSIFYEVFLKPLLKNYSSGRRLGIHHEVSIKSTHQNINSLTC